MPVGTVLVIDDDRSACRGLGRLPGSAGYEVTAFASFSDFVAAPMPEGPACLVLDATMPGSVQDRVRHLGERAGPLAALILALSAGYFLLKRSGPLVPPKTGSAEK